MLTIAEGYETEVYDKHHYINDLQNYVLASTKIWWKYNSGIGDLLLNSLQNNWVYLGDLQYDIIAFKEYRVVPTLIGILQAPASKLIHPSIYQEDPILRTIAIETLGVLKDIRAVEPIIKILQDTDRDKYTRYEAIEALGQLKSEKAVKPLIEILNDEKSELIAEASWALIKLGTAAVEPLIDTLQHHNSEIRMFTASALGKIKDRRAIKPLYNLLQHQPNSQELLYTLGGGGFPPIASALAELKATEELIDALNHYNPNVRQQAAWALGEIDDIVVVQPLLNAMNDTDSEVKKEARLSLIKLSSQSSEIESMLPF
jgi:HEAT repeat protein